jgi:hypothetical protein
MPTVTDIITNFFVLLIGMYLGTMFPDLKPVVFGGLICAAIIYGLLKLDERGISFFRRG